MADLLDKHVAAILRLLDETDDIVSALYRQGANKDYKCKSLREKLRAIEKELTEVDSVPKWIPCSERLPEEHKVVLVSTTKGYVDVAVLQWGKWFPHDYNGVAFPPNRITAWMPKPDAYEPPESEGDVENG